MDNPIAEDVTKTVNKSKEYYKNHLEKIKRKNKCDICNGSYTTYNKSKHIQTLKHQMKLQPSVEAPVETEHNN